MTVTNYVKGSRFETFRNLQTCEVVEQTSVSLGLLKDNSITLRAALIHIMVSALRGCFVTYKQQL